MRRHFAFLLLLLVCMACNPEVDVYAPERELYAVYGVLNPQAPQQYITITKVFQTEGDAYLYAAQNDLTARGMQVSLQSDSMIWQADLIDMPDTFPGLFPRTTGVYRLQTAGVNSLVPGRRYDLRITKPDNAEFIITAWTVIPTAPVLTSPGPPLYSEQLQTFTFPTIDFYDDLLIVFQRGSGSGFELRLYVTYWDGQAEKVAQWGPSPIFKEPKNCRANTGQGEMCYELPELAVPNSLHSIFDDYHPDTVDVFDTIRVAHTLDSLSRHTWLEVTGVDSFLTNYLVANSPFGFGLNLLMDKPEFTNITGGNTGVFGSINTSYRYVFLGGCARWLAGLRGKRPPGCGQ